MIRRLAELLARGRRFRRRVRVAGQLAPIWVSPDAQLKYLKPGERAFDRDLFELAEQRLGPNDVVWDVGANIGSFSVAAATVATSGEVVAIEADIWLAGLLRQTAAEPFFGGRLKVVHCAAAAEAGEARFVISARGRASNALEVGGGRSQMVRAREIVLVPTLRLDDLLDQLAAPTFVKIDVEGAELLVLRGASRLLREIRPRIYVEVDQRLAGEVMALLVAANYAAFDPRTGERLERCLENTLFEPL